jgi:hypothetical protein
MAEGKSAWNIGGLAPLNSIGWKRLPIKFNFSESDLFFSQPHPRLVIVGLTRQIEFMISPFASMATTAWDAGVQGIKRSGKAMNQHAQGVERFTQSVGSDSAVVALSEEAQARLANRQGAELQPHVVGLMESETSYRASVGVIRSSQERFDALLDLVAPESD